ncbi:hypothetical protein C8Q80DRAFT_1275529 [Daedaleopsis nitida]|nr:hypothetical protein C8Q80DRAFT_1275529 [Daedaleopsis nitida]
MSKPSDSLSDFIRTTCACSMLVLLASLPAGTALAMLLERLSKAWEIVRPSLRYHARFFVHFFILATPDATSKLVSLIVEAVGNANKASALYAQFKSVKDTLLSAGTVSNPDAVFIRNNTPEIEHSVGMIGEDAARLKTTFSEWKKCFYLLSNKDEVEKCWQAIHGCIVSAGTFVERVTPAMDTLVRLARDRQRILEEVHQLGDDIAIDWYSIASGEVEQTVYRSTTAKFRPLLARIHQQKTVHDEALLTLENLHKFAISHPTEIPAPGQTDGGISSEMLKNAFDAYGSLTERCRDLIKSSGPVIKSLNEFIDGLHTLLSESA